MWSGIATLLWFSINRKISLLRPFKNKIYAGLLYRDKGGTIKIWKLYFPFQKFGERRRQICHSCLYLTKVFQSIMCRSWNNFWSHSQHNHVSPCSSKLEVFQKHLITERDDLILSIFYAINYIKTCSSFSECPNHGKGFLQEVEVNSFSMCLYHQLHIAGDG